VLQEAEKFHDWGKMQFVEYDPQPWSCLVPGASEVEVDIVSKLVTYESGSRMTAEQVRILFIKHSTLGLWQSQALRHPYFMA
jgi:hypothetical protein